MSFFGGVGVSRHEKPCNDLHETLADGNWKISWGFHFPRSVNTEVSCFIRPSGTTLWATKTWHLCIYHIYVYVFMHEYADIIHILCICKICIYII